MFIALDERQGCAERSGIDPGLLKQCQVECKFMRRKSQKALAPTDAERYIALTRNEAVTASVIETERA